MSTRLNIRYEVVIYISIYYNKIVHTFGVPNKKVSYYFGFPEN